MNKIKICKSCLNRKFELSRGVFCGLTNEKPTFELECPDYALDIEQKAKLEEAEADRAKILDTATAGKRFGNYVLDVIGFYILSLFLGLIIGVFALVFGFDISWLENMGKINEYLFGFTVMTIYYVFFEAIFGQTPGKMITGTKVVTETGEKPSLEKILARSLCRFIPFEAFSFLGNSAIGWHDSISGTRVINKPLS